MTEPAHLSRTRAAYDTVAADYADMLRDLLAQTPMDRAVLTAFADLVKAAGGGPVGDLGCGPGRITSYLDGLGLDVFGVDLSPGMIAVAREAYPHLPFTVGSLDALDIADGSLSGAVTWYSIIHTPPERMPAVFAELSRVLAPGGQLLLAFQVGDELLRLEQAYGHTVSYDVWRLPPERITALAAEAGLVVHTRLIRAPGEREKTPQAYLAARKTAAPS